MIIESALPEVFLRPYIRKYWRNTSYSPNEMVINLYPKGLAFLIFSFGTKGKAIKNGRFFKEEPKAFVSGQITKYGFQFTSKGHAKIVGVEITPLGLYKLFGIPVNEFNNDVEDITLIDPKINALYEHISQVENFNEVKYLLDQYLSQKFLKSKIEFSPYVLNAFQMIIGNVSLGVKEMAKKSFISERQLHRGFINQLGISPKNLMALQKAHLVLNDVLYNNENNLERLSYKWGYFDPPHLTHSFKKFFNSSPSHLNLKQILQLEDFHGWKEFSSFIK